MVVTELLKAVYTGSRVIKANINQLKALMLLKIKGCAESFTLTGSKRTLWTIFVSLFLDLEMVLSCH